MYRRIARLIAAALLVPALVHAADLVVPAEVPTLEDAIARLRDGDRIVLLPGDYTVVAKPPEGVAFSIVGRGGRDSTRLSGGDPLDAIFTVTGGMAPLGISGITFDRSQEPNPFSLLIKQRKVAIEDCRFLGGAGAFLDSCEGSVRTSEFRGCFDGLRLQGSPVLVEGNEFGAVLQYSLVARGSDAKVYGNTFRECGNSCILVVGKNNVPVVGGSREHANRFLSTKHLVIASQSRLDVNARHNYWGPAVTSTMDRLGYPASIEEIHDNLDQEDKASGTIDYRNWLPSAEEAGKPSFGGSTGSAIVLFVLAVVLYVVLKRRRRARA